MAPRPRCRAATGTGACNLVILSSDAAGTAKDTPALSSNKDPSATFYATFSDMNLGAPDDRVTYNAGDEPEGSPSPVVTYSLTPPDYGKLPASGVKESVLFCPVDPSVPTNVINTANCSSTCGGITGSGATSVSASGACYPVTSLTLAPRREVSFSASGTGAGITKLGVTATAEVVVREPSQADPSGKKFSYTGATKDAKVTLTLCVRESPDGICSKVTATKGAFACSTKTETDACGFARTVDCGTCETGNTCCTDGTGKSCVNTTTDMYNCGSCGNNCYAKGFGSPACCTGVCVDLLAGTPAKTHCGSCGNNCTGALTCQSGECL